MWNGFASLPAIPAAIRREKAAFPPSQGRNSSTGGEYLLETIEEEEQA